MTRDRWREIRALIEQDIMDGLLHPGAKLPTEPELIARYGAGRHSVRRAVADLAKSGLLSVEQGRGTFVTARPRINYFIGARTRMRRNLTPQGIEVISQFLGSEDITASGRVAEKLGLEEGAPVMVTRSLTFADGLPVSWGTLHHDARRFADFAERRQELGSVTKAYASYGIHDYLRARTQIHARPARSEEAQTLKQHPDMPVLVVRALDREADGTPLAWGEVIWSAARVSFDVNFDTEFDGAPD